VVWRGPGGRTRRRRDVSELQRDPQPERSRQSLGLSVLVAATFVTVVILMMFALMVVTVVAIMISVMVSVMISVMVSIMVSIIMSVMWDVFFVVPILSHEEDGASAGVVFRTMPAPVLLMTGRNMQVNRRSRHIIRSPRDDDRLRVDDRRVGNITDVNLPIQSGLSEADGNPNIATERRCRKGSQQDGIESLVHALSSVDRRSSSFTSRKCVVCRVEGTWSCRSDVLYPSLNMSRRPPVLPPDESPDSPPEGARYPAALVSTATQYANVEAHRGAGVAGKRHLQSAPPIA